MKRMNWLVVTIAIMGSSIFAAWGAPHERVATVGDFALRVSRVLGQQPADMPAAVATLRKAGVDVGNDVSAVLTEARVAGILRDLGLQVSAPALPDAGISMAKLGQIVIAFALTRGHTHVSSGHGHDCHVSSSDPDDCDDDHDGGDHDGDGHHGGDQGGDHDHDGDHDGGHDDDQGHH
jgi:hypothetical protein